MFNVAQLLSLQQRSFFINCYFSLMIIIRLKVTPSTSNTIQPPTFAFHPPAVMNDTSSLFSLLLLLKLLQNWQIRTWQEFLWTQDRNEIWPSTSYTGGDKYLHVKEWMCFHPSSSQSLFSSRKNTRKVLCKKQRWRRQGGKTKTNRLLFGINLLWFLKEQIK